MHMAGKQKIYVVGCCFFVFECGGTIFHGTIFYGKQDTEHLDTTCILASVCVTSDYPQGHVTKCGATLKGI